MLTTVARSRWFSSASSSFSASGSATLAGRSTLAGMAGARPRTAVRTAVVWEVLRDALSTLSSGAVGPASSTLSVLDAGGGTGGFAVPLAELGHRVTVVDPSPDSLAALERRAAESG